jgi:hypothetical protein
MFSFLVHIYQKGERGGGEFFLLPFLFSFFSNSIVGIPISKKLRNIFLFYFKEVCLKLGKRLFQVL